MSSKARRKAREWMTAKCKESDAAVFKAGRAEYRKGAEAMRKDMMALVPKEDRGILVIDQFPNPRKSGPHFQVNVVDQGPALWADFDYHPGRMAHRVLFTPVKHALTFQSPGGPTSLQWFSWEPRDYGEAAEHTRALVEGMGKLRRAEWMLESIGARDALVCVREVRHELRRRLGEYAPDPEGNFR